jgi:hypothetical protein
LIALFACAGDSTTSQAEQSRPAVPSPTLAQQALEVPAPIWGGTTTVQLIAGQHTVVGTVTAAMVDGKLQVSYALNPPWAMTQSHLDVETDAQRIPQTRNHFPLPDQFAHQASHVPAVTAFSYQQDITWQPGDTLFIAAQAEIRRFPQPHDSDDDDHDDCSDRSPSDTDEDDDETSAGIPDRIGDDDRDDDGDHGDDPHGRHRGHHNHHDQRAHHGVAWAAGTRFRPHFSRAMYFAFKPTVTAIIGGGTNWQLARVAGQTTDGTNTAFDDSLFLLQSDGIAAAPLPADIQADLADDTAPPDRFVVVSQTIVSEIVASQRAGALTPALQAIAEPEDPLSAASLAVQPRGLFGRCSNQDIVKTKVIDLSQLSIPLFSHSLGQNVTANLSLNGVTQGSVTLEVHLTKKRFGFKPFCIPYAVEFNSVRVVGSATIDLAATLQGTISVTEAFEKQLLKLTLLDLWFLVGPVPVRLLVNLPFSIGADIEASVTGSLSYTTGQRATGSLNYTCTFSGCTGSSSFQLVSANSPATLTGSVSGRLKPSVWAEVAVRAALYSDLLAFVQVGAQPFLRGDLWGFLGNDCGDGDGNGTTESVSALTFDLDSELVFNIAAAVFNRDPSRHTLFSTGRHHLKFLDLIGSSALSPVIEGPASTGVRQSAGYRVAMRSCWPYSDRVFESVSWGDGESVQTSGLPSTGATVFHAWSQGGEYPVTATSMRDDHGRSWEQSTSRTVEVTSAPVGPIPTDNLHLWLRADVGVTAPVGRVSDWTDQSGNGRNAVMPIASRQPELFPGVLNGNPVVRFAGAQSLGLSVFAGPTTFTVFIVGRNTKTSGESIILGPGGSSPNNQLRWENDTQALFVGTGNDLPVTISTIGNTRVFHALSTRYDGGTMTVYRDGDQTSSDSFTTSGPWIFASIGSFFSEDFMEGDLAELLIYDRALSEVERQTVNAYLRSKYALP